MRKTRGFLAGDAGGHAGLAQAAKAFYQHRCGQKGVISIDQIIEKLVVASGANIEELPYCRLLCPCVSPPTTLEIEYSRLQIA